MDNTITIVTVVYNDKNNIRRTRKKTAKFG